MTDGPQYPAYPGDPQEPGRVPPQQGGYPQQPGPEQPGTYPQGQQPGWGQDQGYQGYQPAPPASGYGHPAAPYASWGSRVGAYLLDALIGFGVTVVPFVVGLVIMISTAESTENLDGTVEVTDAGNPLGWILMVLAGLIGLAFTIWNMIVRQGRTGQSLGKKIVGIKVVREQDGRVLGVGMAFLRYVLYSILSGACFLDLLWPLWEERKRTWHDMIVSSVVVRA